MNSGPAIAENEHGSLRLWAPVLAGIAVLYVPAYFDVYRVFWRPQSAMHGPVMLAMVAWLLWRDLRGFQRTSQPGSPFAGVALLGLGLLMYVVGRGHAVHQLEIGSQIPVMLGILQLMLGPGALRRAWLPLVLLVFLVPIPGSILDQFLLPLKEWVSGTVDTTLHALGYPIARSGVVLVIGSYSLLIADACSGLNSMVALTGIGLLYVHLAAHSSRALNVALVLSILPIAFLANIIRVMALVLVTYYGGESSGRAFHDNASYAEIALAFGGFFAFEQFMQWCMRMRSTSPGLHPPVRRLNLIASPGRAR